MTILGVIAINDDAPVQVKENFYDQLNDEIKKGTSRETILLGDFKD